MEVVPDVVYDIRQHAERKKQDEVAEHLDPDWNLGMAYSEIISFPLDQFTRFTSSRWESGKVWWQHFSSRRHNGKGRRARLHPWGDSDSTQRFQHLWTGR
jgi:hypothetical protein